MQNSDSDSDSDNNTSNNKGDNPPEKPEDPYYTSPDGKEHILDVDIDPPKNTKPPQE